MIYWSQVLKRIVLSDDNTLVVDEDCEIYDGFTYHCYFFHVFDHVFVTLALLS